MKTTACIWVLAGLGCLPASAQSGREGFADAIVAADGQVASGQREYMKQLQPFQDGKPGDMAALEQSYSRLSKAVSAAKAAARSLTPPAKSPDCVELQRTFLSYLDSETAVLKHLSEVVAKVKAANGTLDLLAKLQVIGQLKKCGEAEDGPRQGFIDAARAFDRVEQGL